MNHPEQPLEMNYQDVVLLCARINYLCTSTTRNPDTDNKLLGNLLHDFCKACNVGITVYEGSGKGIRIRSLENLAIGGDVFDKAFDLAGFARPIDQQTVIGHFVWWDEIKPEEQLFPSKPEQLSNALRFWNIDDVNKLPQYLLGRIREMQKSGYVTKQVLVYGWTSPDTKPFYIQIFSKRVLAHAEQTIITLCVLELLEFLINEERRRNGEAIKTKAFTAEGTDSSLAELFIRAAESAQNMADTMKQIAGSLTRQS